MITLNDTHQSPKPPLTYRIRDEAKNAAIAVLGPLAIHEFDFVTFQLDDGRWDWNVPVEERPLSAAMIKANGGRKFLAARAASMASTPMAHVEAAKPVKLPMPPRRMPRPARSEPAGAPDGGASGEQPPSDEKPPSGIGPAFIVNAPADDLQTREAMLNDLNPACNGLDVNENPPGLTVTPLEGGTLTVGDKLTYPDGSDGRIIAQFSMPSCNGLDIAKLDDGLDLPTFLKREPAPAKSGTYDELKASGRLRSEPVAAPVKEPRRIHALTKSAVTTVGKPPVSRKVAKAKTAPKAKKSATKVPTKLAGASGGKANIGTVARTAILKGKSNEEALAAVMRAFPDCSSNAGCMAWYRNKLKKDGFLRQDGTPSAKGEALLSDPTRAA